MRMPALVAFGLLALTIPTLVEAQQPTHKPGGFHSPDIQQGESWSFVFNQTGRFYYHCHPHPFMEATIDVVEGEPTSPVTIDIRGFRFVPDSLRIGRGTNVTWINHDASFHTIDESVPPAEPTDVPGVETPGIGLLVALVAVVSMAVMLARGRQR